MKIVPITEIDEECRPVGCLPCFFANDRESRADVAVINGESITGMCANHAEVQSEEASDGKSRK